MIDHDLARSHVPAQKRLRHRVHLIVMRPIGERDALLNEIVYPRCVIRVREEHVASFDQGAYGGCTPDLASLGITGSSPGISCASI